MLDQIEMASRRYKQIAPSTGGEMALSQADQLAQWLERPVCNITESLLTRPGFRRHAFWPIKRLTGELDCPEREAVRAVENSLVCCAEALQTFARNDAIWQQLHRMGRYGGEVVFGDPIALDGSPDAPAPVGFRQMECIASRPWHDLASVSDYFRPTSGLNLAERDGLKLATFLPYFNRTLRTPGDFISRCMEIRIDHWRQLIHKFYIRCHTAQQRVDLNFGSSWKELQDAHSELSRNIDLLHEMISFGAEAQVRDSCIALLQIYAGFRPNADWDWLGLCSQMASGVADYSYRVKQRNEWEIPERAAAALVDIADIACRQSPDDLIDEKRRSKRLVLIEEERRGYFDGEPIEASNGDDNWHGTGNFCWELLWVLAERAQTKQSVDAMHLSNHKNRKPPTVQAVKDRRSGLKKRIVTALNDSIIQAGRGTYRLDLPADEICLLGWFSEDRLGVLCPSGPKRFTTESLKNLADRVI